MFIGKKERAWRETMVGDREGSGGGKKKKGSSGRWPEVSKGWFSEIRVGSAKEPEAGYQELWALGLPI